MGNFSSRAARDLSLEISKTDQKISEIYLAHEKALEEMQATITNLQRKVTEHNEEQVMFSNILDNEIVPVVVIARGKIAEIERDKFGDIDVYEGQYDSESDSESEGTQSLGSEAGSGFLAALARMGREWKSEYVVDRSAASTLEPGEQVQEPLREGPGEGGWRDYLVRPRIAWRLQILIHLVLIFLYFPLACSYFFN